MPSFLSRLGGMLNPLNTFRGIRSGVQALRRGDTRGALQGLGGATLGFDLNTSLGRGRRRPNPAAMAEKAARFPGFDPQGNPMAGGAPPMGGVPQVGMTPPPGGFPPMQTGAAPALPGGAGIAQGVDQARRLQEMQQLGARKAPGGIGQVSY